MPQELDKFLSKNTIFSNETIVLEKTENSELAEELLPATAYFFEKVFAPQGPYWNTYIELEFGETPVNTQYLAIVNNQMYFCKNAEKRFLHSAGLIKKFSYQKPVLKEKIEISFENFLMLISTPFNFARQITTIALAALRINEELEKFEEFYEKTKQFWEKNSTDKTLDPQELAEICIEGALQSMKYSFYSSIAYGLKIKLKDSDGWKKCELEELSKLLSAKEEMVLDKIKKEFGFYSKNPYDISIPRFSETPTDALAFKDIKFPMHPAARWRENCKFLCARYLAILRKCFLLVAEKKDLGKKVFFLKPPEFSDENIYLIIRQREKTFEESKNNSLPKTLIYDGQWNIENPTSNGQIQGMAAGGQRTVVGELVFIESEKDFQKNLTAKIVFSKTLSPNLVILFDRVVGIISAGGGMTAHTSIVALEHGMPCIVQTKNWEMLKEGEKVKINGATGKIEKID